MESYHNRHRDDHAYDRRPVSKRACLGCREKKIKCDGEVRYGSPSTNGKAAFTYKTCSNCLASGIECVYVPSKRGGRKKSVRSAESDRSTRQSSLFEDPMTDPETEPHHFRPAEDRFPPFPPPQYGFAQVPYFPGFPHPGPPPPPHMPRMGGPRDWYEFYERPDFFHHHHHHPPPPPPPPPPQVVALTKAEQLPPGLTEDGLYKIGLPCFATLYNLIDLYYRYINGSYMILPNMHILVQSLSTSAQCVALIATMAQFSCTFISSEAVEDPKFLSPVFWAGILARYKEQLCGYEMLHISLLNCIPSNDSQILATCEQIRFFSYQEMITIRSSEEMDEYIRMSTPAQIMQRESFVRILWDAYRFQVSRKVFFGEPYQSEALLEFDGNLEVPMPDISYYGHTESAGFKKDYKNLPKLADLQFDSLRSEDMYDSLSTVLTTRLLDEAIMMSASDSPGNLALRLQQLCALEAMKPYRLNRSLLIINQETMLSCFQADLASIIMRVRACNKMILWPLRSDHLSSILENPYIFSPREGQEQKGPNDFPRDCSQPEWQSFICAIESALDVCYLVELGEGICPESSQSGYPCTPAMEPAMSQSSSSSNVPPEHDAWLAYPFVAVSVVMHAVSVLCSFAMASKVFSFSVQSDQLSILDSDSEIASVTMEADTFESRLPRLFLQKGGLPLWTRIQDKVGELERFLGAQGRYSNDVKFVGHQVSGLVRCLNS